MCIRDSDRAVNRKEIAKISLTGNLLETYSCDVYMGAISHYSGNQFILLRYQNYEGTTTIPFSKELRFYIGEFLNKKFVPTKEFVVINPTFSEEENVANYLQDIHYDPSFGLYFITLTAGVDYMFRVLPEQIQNAKSSEPFMPAEQYVFEDAVKEAESPFIADNGNMYITENGANNVDRLDKVQTLTFKKN